MTRTEAVEALHRAANDAVDNWNCSGTSLSSHSAAIRLLRAALDAYSTSTPDPLPAEVQRVLEAAARWHYAPSGALSLACHTEMRDAIEAYCERVQFAQPEPLSARLARLRPGSVVSMNDAPNRYEVLANHVPSKTLFVAWDGDCCAAFDYSCIDSILSESP